MPPYRFPLPATFNPYLHQAADLGVAAGALLGQLESARHGQWLMAAGLGAGVLIRMAGRLAACRRRSVTPDHHPV